MHLGERGARARRVRGASDDFASGMREVLIKELTWTLVFLKTGRNLLLEEEKNISAKVKSMWKAWRRIGDVGPFSFCNIYTLC